ncbi:MAG TPA: glycerate kinase [Micromonosporaceae bacterium]
MRVLVCPDKFAGTLSAVAAADAVRSGWLTMRPDDEVATLPLSDGGPGFLDVVEAALGRSGQAAPPIVKLPVATVDPLGRPVTGLVLLAGHTAYVESAQVCGLHLLAEGERDPLRTTSFGLGALIVAAVESGASEVVIGLGGSATNDGGAGMLAALGAAPVDRAGYVLPYGGAVLASCVGLTGVPRLRAARLVAATDVDNPLTGPAGAAAVFGPQKGASAAEVEILDVALRRFAEVLGELPTCPPEVGWLPGAGAAGGIGAAILACGGRRESGFGLVRALVGVDAAIGRADLVITGEGSFDEQSLRGKVTAGVAGVAKRLGRPCLVLAGRVTVDQRAAAAAGVSAAYALVDHVGSIEAAVARPEQALAGLAERVARHPALPDA